MPRGLASWWCALTLSRGRRRTLTRYQRGCGWMFGRHVLQADQGGDFDFLETSFGAAVPEPDIF